MFQNDPKLAMPKITGLVWPDRGNRPYVSYDTANFALLGEETLPFLPADTAGAAVDDRRPGEVVAGGRPFIFLSPEKYWRSCSN